MISSFLGHYSWLVPIQLKGEGQIGVVWVWVWVWIWIWIGFELNWTGFILTHKSGHFQIILSLFGICATCFKDKDVYQSIKAYIWPFQTFWFATIHSPQPTHCTRLWSTSSHTKSSAKARFYGQRRPCILSRRPIHALNWAIFHGFWSSHHTMSWLFSVRSLDVSDIPSSLHS